MTRFFWTLIALFPLPLVVLLLAGPPELFDRERVLAAREVAARLDATPIDWTAQFGNHRRIYLAQLLPDEAIAYERFGFAFEYGGTPNQPVLIAPTGLDTELRYRLAEACWDVPEGRLIWMRGC